MMGCWGRQTKPKIRVTNDERLARHQTPIGPPHSPASSSRIARIGDSRLNQVPLPMDID